MELVRPAREHLASYVDALSTGWSSDNVRGKVAADEHLARIARDADAFLASLEDREARGDPIALPDGTHAKRIPGFVRWMWDGEYCGSIGFRWQPGTEALPPHCLGHIGYSVVPWKHRRGLRDIRAAPGPPGRARRRPALRRGHLRSVERGVAARDRGQRQEIVETLLKPAAFGGTPGLRYRIAL